MSSTFAKNLEILRRKNPTLAKQIEVIDPSTIQVAETEKKETNFIDVAPTPPHPIHDPKGAREETKRHWNSLDLAQSRVIFLFGVGVGYFYECAKQWLEEKKSYLVIIEDDLRILYCLLELESTTSLLEDPRVHLTAFLFDPKNPHLLDEFTEELAWYYNYLSFTITSLPSYSHLRPNRFRLLNEALTHQIHHVNTWATFHGNLDPSELENRYRNYLNFKETPRADLLAGKGLKIPAIICGAGPSLEKQLPLLKEIEDRALIIATGSAIPILDRADVRFHLGLIIDPSLPYLRFRSLRPGNGSIIHKSRVSPSLLELLGPDLLFFPESGLQPVEKWLTDNLNFFSSFQLGGYTVGDVGGKLASYLGCSPIIFVGVDLAFTGESYYAKSALFQDKERKSLVDCKDIEGNPSLTKVDWLLSSEKTSDLTYEFPEITYLNATEGGIGFAQIPNTTFREAIDQHLQKQWDVEQILYALKTECPPVPFTQNEVIAQLERADESLQNIEILLHELLKELLKILEETKQQGKETLILSDKIAQLEEALKRETTFELFLDFYWEIFDKLLHRLRTEMEELLPPGGEEWRHKKTQVEFLLKTAKEHREVIKRVLPQ